MSEQINTPNEEVTRLASQFHEQWRESRLLENGGFEPRVKDTNDSEWSVAHSGATQVDIANTPFEDLPTDWQAENMAAAETAQGTLNEGFANFEDIKSDEFIEKASSNIHDEWVGRNSSYAEESGLNVPYDQLPEDEKSKDRAQILTAVELSLYAEKE